MLRAFLALLLLGGLLGAVPHTVRAQNWQADNALSVFSEIVPDTDPPVAVQICGAGCRVYPTPKNTCCAVSSGTGVENETKRIVCAVCRTAS
jgi:hypothetical protein